MSFTEALSRSGFEMVDFIILLVYLVMLVSLGIFLSSNSRKGNAKDYFLAGNSLTWWAVGASLIAANISTEQFIGMAGSGYADGIAISAYELMAAVTLIVIAKWLLPAMMDRKIFTIPQFLRERYNSGVGVAFSIYGYSSSYSSTSPRWHGWAHSPLSRYLVFKAWWCKSCQD